MPTRARRTLIRFGERLYALRLERDWTLAQAAKRSGVSTATISMLERGISSTRPDQPTDPRLSNVIGLARAFDTTLSELVEDRPPPRGWKPPARRERIGQRIRRFRTERGLSVEQLARKAKVGTVVLYEWEQGTSYHHGNKVDPQLLTLLKMAKALKMTLSEMVGA